MNEMKETARRYWQMGLAVVPFQLSWDGEKNGWKKKPLCDWGRWQTEPQTLEEFESFKWDEVEAFGVLLGKTKDWLNLCCIDIDSPDFDLNLLPKTRVEKTVSNGYHAFYLSKREVAGVKRHDLNLELLGRGNLVIVYPSKGYERIGDTEPVVVENAEALFYKLIAEVGGEIKPETEKQAENEEVLAKWMGQILEKLDVAGEGAKYAYAHCPFHKPDKNPSFALHKTKFYGIDFHDGKAYNLKQLAQALGVELEGERREEEELNLYDLAEKILKETPIATDIRSYLMFRWDGKCWVDDAEGIIHKRLVEVEGANYKPYHLTTLTQIVQGLTFQNGLEEPPYNLICFENGVLDLTTMELKPHTPKLFFRNIIHAEYNPAARAEEFLKWLKEVLPEEDAQKCVQEIFGYCLLRSYPFHHMFFLVGSGRNGKGTLIRTLIGLLGKENCVSIPLERLPERFQAANLIGKLANVVSEPKTTLVTTETIKMLTGEDLITAEFKNKQKTVQFTNYAKLVVVANRLPPINDSSLAWWERVVVVEFPVTIPEDKRIPNIEQKWLNSHEERSGIVNWALEGLKRLLEKRCFTRGETMLNVVEQYKRWSQPSQYFLDKYCVCAPTLWISKKALYEAFKIVCEEEDLPVASEEAFSREVRKKPRVTLSRKRVEGKIERVWLGINLKPREDETGSGEEGQASVVEERQQIVTTEGHPTVINGRREKGIGYLTVPDVPSVPGFSHSREISADGKEEGGEGKGEFFKELEKGGTLGTPVHTSSFPVLEQRVSRVCGDCVNFHKPSCSVPFAGFESLPADATFACDCPGFKLKEESNSISDTPKGFFQCEFCAEQGKRMFWATMHDLQEHIQAWHSESREYVR